MTDEAAVAEDMALTVLKPLRLPKRRTESYDEHGNPTGVHIPNDAVEAFDRDGNPLGHLVNAGDEIRPVYVPGQTVHVDAELGAKLIKARVVAAPGANLSTPEPEVFDAETLA